MPICGHSLMIDEIALEEWPIFIQWLNSMGGLCQEHTKGISLHMTNISVLKSLADMGIRPSPTVHYAKEVTIASITAFQSEHYDVMPVFVAGTCKTEKAPKCSELIEALLDAWRESLDGEAHHGPI